MRTWIVEDRETYVGVGFVVVQAETIEEAQEKAAAVLPEVSGSYEVKFDGSGVSKRFAHLE